MVAPLKRVLVRKPDASFGAADPRRWHYAAKPNLAAARKEHDALVRILKAAGAEVHYHDAPLKDKADAIFVHDPAIVTDEGAILLRMGKVLRRGEEESIGKALGKAGMPILGTLRDPAIAEGGDLVWLDPNTLAVGQGFRTNVDGLRQLADLLGELGVDTVPVPLPYFEGPDACLHLMSVISLVAEDLAVIYPRLLPVTLWRHLKSMGFDFVEVPDEEFPTMAPNVLALRPREGVMLEGNPTTKGRLEDAGCRVTTYRGREISLKAEGGATCLTRSVLRAA